jgi:hypothetical protein
MTYDTYKQEEVVAGYVPAQLVNLRLQLILEEEKKRLLDDNSFVFSYDIL